MSKLRKLFTIALMTASLGACAITEDIVPVTFQGTDTSISIGADGKAFELAVTDKRGKYRGRIGAKVNGFGSEMADIKSTIPVPEIVQDAFIKELTARKLLISNSDGRKIEVSITAFHNNFEVGQFTGKARGIVAFIVKLTDSNGDIAFEDAISKVHITDGIMLMTGDNAAASVSNALNDAMSDLFQNKEFINAIVRS